MVGQLAPAARLMGACAQVKPLKTLLLLGCRVSGWFGTAMDAKRAQAAGEGSEAGDRSGDSKCC